MLICNKLSAICTYSNFRADPDSSSVHVYSLLVVLVHIVLALVPNGTFVGKPKLGFCF